MEPGSLRWSLRVDEAASGPDNMARDHATALTLPPGRGVVRFYRWSVPTLSLGRNEPTAGRWDRSRLEAAAVPVVRRPTGGRAVLHHRELTYAVVVPAAGPGSMRRLYQTVNRGLAAGLAALGVPAERALRRGPAPRPEAGPCFHHPAEGEVTAGGRKLVGSAQVRVEGRLLQHGSILLADDQRRLAELAGGADDEDAAAVTHLSAWLDPLPSTEALVAALAPALAEALGGDWHGEEPAPTLDGTLLARLERHYRSASWTWRR